MDTELIALHRAVNALLRACRAVKAAGRALGRVRGNAWLPRWDGSALTDTLEDKLSAARARQHEAEDEVLARWEEFNQDYATPELNS